MHKRWCNALCGGVLVTINRPARSQITGRHALITARTDFSLPFAPYPCRVSLACQLYRLSLSVSNRCLSSSLSSRDNHISNLLKLKTPPAPLQGVEARGKGNRSKVEIHQWFFSNPLSKLIIEARRCLCVTVAGVEHGGRVPTAYIY